MCPLTGSKLTWGPKLQYKVNLWGLKRDVFQGDKITTLRNLQMSLTLEFTKSEVAVKPIHFSMRF